MTITIFVWSVIASVVGSAVFAGIVQIVRRKNDRLGKGDH